MRISDWSSDVCSSDLHQPLVTELELFGVGRARELQIYRAVTREQRVAERLPGRRAAYAAARGQLAAQPFAARHGGDFGRSVPRRKRKWCLGQQVAFQPGRQGAEGDGGDRKSTRLNSSH